MSLNSGHWFVPSCNLISSAHASEKSKVCRAGVNSCRVGKFVGKTGNLRIFISYNFLMGMRHLLDGSLICTLTSSRLKALQFILSPIMSKHIAKWNDYSIYPSLVFLTIYLGNIRDWIHFHLLSAMTEVRNIPSVLRYAHIV